MSDYLASTVHRPSLLHFYDFSSPICYETRRFFLEFDDHELTVFPPLPYTAGVDLGGRGAMAPQTAMFSVVNNNVKKLSLEKDNKAPPKSRSGSIRP